MTGIGLRILDTFAALFFSIPSIQWGAVLWTLSCWIARLYPVSDYNVVTVARKIKNELWELDFKDEVDRVSFDWIQRAEHMFKQFWEEHKHDTPDFRQRHVLAIAHMLVQLEHERQARAAELEVRSGQKPIKPHTDASIFDKVHASNQRLIGRGVDARQLIGLKQLRKNLGWLIKFELTPWIHTRLDRYWDDNAMIVAYPTEHPYILRCTQHIMLTKAGKRAAKLLRELKKHDWEARACGVDMRHRDIFKSPRHAHETKVDAFAFFPSSQEEKHTAEAPKAVVFEEVPLDVEAAAVTFEEPPPESQEVQAEVVAFEQPQATVQFAMPAPPPVWQEQGKVMVDNQVWCEQEHPPPVWQEQDEVVVDSGVWYEQEPPPPVLQEQDEVVVDNGVWYEQEAQDMPAVEAPLPVQLVEEEDEEFVFGFQTN